MRWKLINARLGVVAALLAVYLVADDGRPMASAEVRGVVVERDATPSATGSDLLAVTTSRVPTTTATAPSARAVPSTAAPSTSAVPSTAAPSARAVPSTAAPSTSAVPSTAAVPPATAAPVAEVVASSSTEMPTAASEPAPPVPVPEVAPAVPPAPPPPRHETLGSEAEGYLAYPFRSRLSGWTIVYLPGRSGVRGMTFPGERRIEIYIRDGDSAASVARVLAHEVGHAVDLTFNDEADRRRWRDVRGVAPDVPWWPDATTYDFDTLAGDFAEAFATWQTGSSTRSNVAGQSNGDQLAVVAQLANG